MLVQVALRKPTPHETCQCYQNLGSAAQTSSRPTHTEQVSVSLIEHGDSQHSKPDRLANLSTSTSSRVLSCPCSVSNRLPIQSHLTLVSMGNVLISPAPCTSFLSPRCAKDRPPLRFGSVVARCKPSLGAVIILFVDKCPILANHGRHSDSRLEAGPLNNPVASPRLVRLTLVIPCHYLADGL